MGQNNLLQVVSVDFKRQRLDDALQLLSKQNDFYFSYSSNIIPKDSLVTISANSVTVKELLDIMLKEKYEYKEALNYIILRPAPYRLKLIPEEVIEKDNLYTITGFVADEKTGVKVPKASVYEKRLVSSTLTDHEGHFKIRVRKKADDIALTVSKELYRDITIVILPSTEVRSDGKSEYGYDPRLDPNRVERTALGRMFVSSKQKMQSLNLSGFFANKPFQASLTPGLSTHGMFNSQVVNKFSLNLVGGYTSGVEGLEVAAGFNINKGSVQYVQAAGIFNVVGGSVKGAQFAGMANTVIDSVTGVEAAGLYNDVNGNLTGVQLAGFANINKKDVQYFQAAGVVNIVGGAVAGAQVSGLSNVVGDSVTGFQATGFLNEVNGSLEGVQISGAFNRVGGKLTGLQLTGMGNISKIETDGVQIAGMFNYSKRLKGVQLGIINIADSSSGVSIGVFNFIRGGYHKISLYYNEFTNTNVSFKLGNAKFYTVFLGGMNISDNKKVYAFGAGIGHDFILSKKTLISSQITSSTLYLGTWDGLNNLYKITGALNWQLFKKISIFAGPSFNVYDRSNPEPIEGFKNVKPEKLAYNFNQRIKGWIGFEAGITLF